MTSVLPGLLVFGLGATLMVAPLTATVMRSVPVERAGVASAVNTAISDVGPQLAVAVLFVVMTQNFYAALTRDVPGLDVASVAARNEVAPLNVPGPDVSEEIRRAARDASAGAFRLAMEPRRLWKRYLTTNPRFIAEIAAQKIGLRRFELDA